jgi:hypothetical protein
MVKRHIMFICAVAFTTVMVAPIHAEITRTPANLQLELYPIPESPDGPGGEHLIFSFDLLVSDPDGVSAMGFQSTLGVDLPGLIFDDDYHDSYDIETARWVSEAVEDDPDYWLYGVGDGTSYGCPEGSNQFSFNDFHSQGSLQAFASDDIVARYSFIWDGTPGDYTFTLDLDKYYSFVFFDLFTPVGAIAFDPGPFPGGSDYFTVTLVPEPTTLLLLGLGAVVLRKRSR